jgi:Xaa-Pro aminopeptidase
MNPTLGLAERDRRWSAIDAAMRVEGLDAVIAGMTDFRGQKGGFRYFSDERPFHRFGYVLMLAGREPILVLHPMMFHAPRGDWIKDVRFPAHAGTEMAAILTAAGAVRVGLIGADQVMRISDYGALQSAGLALISADAMFEAVRGPKSPAEIAGLEEAAEIADRCFAQLLDIARPGLSEREIGGQLSATALSAGADELLFLTMSGEHRCDHVHALIQAPGAERLTADRPFVFSIELSGPSGFWVELARVIAFGGAEPAAAETEALCRRSVMAGREALRPGISGSDIQTALESPFDALAHAVVGTSGHAIGHDVIELPMIARGADDAIRLQPGMAFAIHPMFNWIDRPMAGYVADTYVLEEGGGRVLSSWPLELYTLPR